MKFFRTIACHLLRDDHVLVARLASEAEYFGMETMLDELQVLASIAPNFPGTIVEDENSSSLAVLRDSVADLRGIRIELRHQDAKDYGPLKD